MTKMLFAAAAIAALLSGQAMADEIHTAVVNTAGVDFNNRAQADHVYGRITATARDICSVNSPNPVLARPDAECMRQAVAQAVRNVNRPLVTAAYERDAADAVTTPSRALAGNDQ